MIYTLMFLSVVLTALVLVSLSPFLHPVCWAVGALAGLIMSYVGYSEFKKEPTKERFLCLLLVIAVMILTLYLEYRWIAFVITTDP